MVLARLHADRSVDHNRLAGEYTSSRLVVSFAPAIICGEPPLADQLVSLPPTQQCVQQPSTPWLGEWPNATLLHVPDQRSPKSPLRLRNVAPTSVRPKYIEVRRRASQVICPSV